MEKIAIVDVTKENWEAICCLHPGKEGAEFVASNSFSIAQSVFEPGWVIKGIEREGVLIGFAMYGLSTDDIEGYELCRFMIDRRYQGKGYGTRALHVIIDEMFRVYGCSEIYLSTAPNNERGKHVYMAAGFVPTGESSGEGEDLEEIYRLERP